MTSKAHRDSNAGMRRGLYVAPFDELAEPRTLIALAVEAEEHGWDGFFLWDHILYRPPVREVADPWVVLSAIAAHTEHLRLGPLVTPLSRRRVHKVARETATLDRLSRGRLILGSASAAIETASLSGSARWSMRANGRIDSTPGSTD